MSTSLSYSPSRTRAICSGIPYPYIEMTLMHLKHCTANEDVDRRIPHRKAGHCPARKELRGPHLHPDVRLVGELASTHILSAVPCCRCREVRITIPTPLSRTAISPLPRHSQSNSKDEVRAWMSYQKLFLQVLSLGDRRLSVWKSQSPLHA